MGQAAMHCRIAGKKLLKKTKDALQQVAPCARPASHANQSSVESSLAKELPTVAGATKSHVYVHQLSDRRCFKSVNWLCHVHNSAACTPLKSSSPQTSTPFMSPNSSQIVISMDGATEKLSLD